jgi:cyclophilin family peptidyl-prolyl cis-trans isomerase
VQAPPESQGYKMLRPAETVVECAGEGIAGSAPRDLLDAAIRRLLARDDEADSVVNARVESTQWSLGVYGRRCVTVTGTWCDRRRRSCCVPGRHQGHGAQGDTPTIEGTLKGGRDGGRGGVVRIGDAQGDRIELYSTDARRSNFLHYVGTDYYVGTLFHRVIPGCMVQGGGFEDGLWEKTTGQRPAIRNESANGLKNDVGTIAMARTSDPDSATSQFFINVRNNGSLNRDRCRDGVGYAVFGRIVDGMDVVSNRARTNVRRQLQ